MPAEESSAPTEPRRHARPRERGSTIVAAVVVVAVVAGFLRLMTGSSASGGTDTSHHYAAVSIVKEVAARSLPAPVHCRRCWQPALRESWQIQLSSTPKAPFLKVAMFEVDGFDTTATTVAALHHSLRGRGVVCYIDAGTWENWRPDAGQFPKSLLGKNDGGWPGERWLDIAKVDGALGRLMRARAAMCKRKGFNAVDFDNVDGYTNGTGFHLTASDQLRYDVFLANTAHRLGLAAALKNDLPQIPVLVRYFDFAVNEQCFQYAECLASQNGGYGLDEFVRARRAVFEIEYKLKLAQFCPAAFKDHFNSLRKGLGLGPWRQACG